MSGELVPSQFRYTTTNNRDLVIGDPTDSVGLLEPKYIVFQTSTTAGYLYNPYIGVAYVGGSWQLQFSNNGSTIASFPTLGYSNIFTNVNTFEGATTFTGLVTITNPTTTSYNTINGPIIFNNTSSTNLTTFNCPVVFSNSFTLANGLSVRWAVSFSNNVSIVGSLSIGSNLSISSNTVLLNNSGTTGGTVGGGLIINGTSNLTIASILLSTTTTTSDTWTLITNNKKAINLIGDSSYTMSLNSSGLSANRVYSYPDATGTILTRPSSYAGNYVLYSSSDHNSVLESNITLADLQALTTGGGVFTNGIVTTTGSFSSTLLVSGIFTGNSATLSNNLSIGGALTVGGASVFSQSMTIAGQVNISNTTSTAYSSVGTALYVSGGLGVGKTIWCNALTSTGTVSGTIGSFSTSISTGTGLFSGAVSASSFSGDGSNLTNLTWANITGASTGVVTGTIVATTSILSTGSITGGSFSGPGTGLTGTAAGLSIGGSAASVPFTGVTGAFSTVTTYNSTTRVLGTTYTNSTGKPMLVIISDSGTTTTSVSFGLYVNSVLIANTPTSLAAAGSYSTGYFIVPSSATYSITNITSFTPNTANYIWTEIV
jgi:hypothetical protein